MNTYSPLGKDSPIHSGSKKILQENKLWIFSYDFTLINIEFLYYCVNPTSKDENESS